MHFYSVLVEKSLIICSSQRFIHWGIFKKKPFFHRWDQKMVFTCLCLETGSNICYFWSFTMHSISSSNFFVALVQFRSVLVGESEIIWSSQRLIQGGVFKEKQFFHRWDQENGFNKSTLRNKLQHLLLLKFHHALNIFINFLFAALVHFCSVLL